MAISKQGLGRICAIAHNTMREALRNRAYCPQRVCGGIHHLLNDLE